MPTPFRHALAALLLSTALGMPSTFAADVAGVHFDDHAAVAGSDTVLNGAGLRTRFMLKVYAIGLYGPKRADTVETFAAVPGPKRIQIVTLRELTAEQFADALLDVLPDGEGIAAIGPDAVGEAFVLHAWKAPALGAAAVLRAIAVPAVAVIAVATAPSGL